MNTKGSNGVSDERILGTAILGESVSRNAWRATLPNGKEIVAHLPSRVDPSRFAEGDSVEVEMSAFDFSRGRIRGAKTEEEE